MDDRFDAAQRLEMEAFRDFDRDAWCGMHADDAVSILPNGAVVAGRDEIMRTMAAHFDERAARWSWTELSRRVQADTLGHVLYETVYEVAGRGIRQRALTGVTYAFADGRWRVVVDQGTPLP